MEYLHFFETNSEFDAYYTTNIYNEPWVSYTEDKNRVDYNKMTREMAIFQYIYCNNVTEEDKEHLYSASIGARTWTDGTNCAVFIEFYDNNVQLSKRLNVSKELYGPLEEISYTGDTEKLIDMALPLFKCQGEAEHTWVKPGMST